MTIDIVGIVKEYQQTGFKPEQALLQVKTMTTFTKNLATKDDIRHVKEDIRLVKVDIQLVREDIKLVKEDIQLVKDDLKNTKSIMMLGFKLIDDRFNSMDRRFDAIETEMKGFLTTKRFFKALFWCAGGMTAVIALLNIVIWALVHFQQTILSWFY